VTADEVKTSTFATAADIFAAVAFLLWRPAMPQKTHIVLPIT